MPAMWQTFSLTATFLIASHFLNADAVTKVTGSSTKLRNMQAVIAADIHKEHISGGTIEDHEQLSTTEKTEDKEALIRGAIIDDRGQIHMSEHEEHHTRWSTRRRRRSTPTPAPAPAANSALTPESSPEAFSTDVYKEVNGVLCPELPGMLGGMRDFMSLANELPGFFELTLKQAPIMCEVSDICGGYQIETLPDAPSALPWPLSKLTASGPKKVLSFFTVQWNGHNCNTSVSSIAHVRSIPRTACLATKLCLNEMPFQYVNDDKFICNCLWGSNQYHDMCKVWNDCIQEKHTEYRDTVDALKNYVAMITNFVQPSLLQRNASTDPLGCIHPDTVNAQMLTCDCLDTFKSRCPLPPAEDFASQAQNIECLRSQLCKHGTVCPSWKTARCTDEEMKSSMIEKRTMTNTGTAMNYSNNPAVLAAVQRSTLPSFVQRNVMEHHMKLKETGTLDASVQGKCFGENGA